MTPTIPFDTLKFYKKLTSSGWEEKAANGLTMALFEVMQDYLEEASKNLHANPKIGNFE